MDRNHQRMLVVLGRTDGQNACEIGGKKRQIFQQFPDVKEVNLIKTGKEDDENENENKNKKERNKMDEVEKKGI